MCLNKTRGNLLKASGEMQTQSDGEKRCPSHGTETARGSQPAHRLYIAFILLVISCP